MMLEKYIANLEGEVFKMLPFIAQRKNFLYVLGSLFLLGIVSKCLVMVCYGRLIRKTQNMASPKSKTLRKIKLKFESVISVNGFVSNPLLLVKRHLNKCRCGFLTLNSLDRLAGWCALLCVVYGGSVGFLLYDNGYEKTWSMTYAFAGCFTGVTLLVAQHTIRTGERQNELLYIITDYLENSMNYREKSRQLVRYGDNPEINIVNGNEAADTDNEAGLVKQKSINVAKTKAVDNKKTTGISIENKGKDSEDSKQDNEKEENKIDEEQIINEVLGEFLQ